MPFSVNLIKRLEAIEPPLKEVLIALLEEVEKQREISITRKEFLEFAKTTEENFQRVWKTIEALAEAQKKTEQRLDSLTQKVEALAEAQKKTEQRLDSLTEKVEALAEAQQKTEIRVNELAEAQKKTEQRLDSLTQKVEALAEAQKKTEIRVNELAEAQKKTEQRLDSLTQKVEALAEAQKKTEEEVRKLAKGLRETRQMVGGLSDTVGYSLEDRAIKSLPQLLREQYQIEVKGRLVRKFIKYNGLKDEVNIFGEAERDGRSLYILGEAKARLSKKHIDKFLKRIQKLKFYKVITEDNFMFFVTYSAEPEIEKYAKDKGIEIIWYYEV